MMTTNRYHGVPADDILQQALDAALRLDGEAARAAMQHDRAKYVTLHAAARDQWQTYRARLVEINQESSKTYLTYLQGV